MSASTKTEDLTVYTEAEVLAHNNPKVTFLRYPLLRDILRAGLCDGKTATRGEERRRRATYDDGRTSADEIDVLRGAVVDWMVFCLLGFSQRDWS